MTEHLSDGKFARKEVSAVEVTKGNTARGRFKKGEPRPANAGRKKGTPNKVTRDYKEFLAALVNDADVQEGIKARIERGDTVGFFRALEHVAGKPVERHEVSVNGNLDVRIRQAAERALALGD